MAYRRLRREASILEIVFLNFRLDDVTLVPTMRKPFDVLAEGLLVQQVGVTGFELATSWSRINRFTTKPISFHVVNICHENACKKSPELLIGMKNRPLSSLFVQNVVNGQTPWLSVTKLKRSMHPICTMAEYVCDASTILPLQPNFFCFPSRNDNLMPKRTIVKSNQIPSATLMNLYLQHKSFSQTSTPIALPRIDRFSA